MISKELWVVYVRSGASISEFQLRVKKFEILTKWAAKPTETMEDAILLQRITRWLFTFLLRCARFLVLKSELELQRNNLDLCGSDLEQVFFLLESGTGDKSKQG